MMVASSSATTASIEQAFLLLRMLNDVSAKAAHWYVPAGLLLQDGAKVVVHNGYTLAKDTAETGLEDAIAIGTVHTWQLARDVSTRAEAMEAIAYIQPRTALGRRLMEIRARIVASGEPLLGWEEIEKELAERRGGEQEPNL